VYRYRRPQSDRFNDEELPSATLRARQALGVAISLGVARQLKANNFGLSLSIAFLLRTQMHRTRDLHHKSDAARRLPPNADIDAPALPVLRMHDVLRT